MDDTMRRGDREVLQQALQCIRAKGVPFDQLLFVCIGTDRSTGDALGPLVGTFLTENGYTNVIGTLEDPCDAQTLPLRLADVPKERITVAIDACLGQVTSVGQYVFRERSLAPGKSVGKTLPLVGNYSIAAIVNAEGPRPYWVLQHTSLHRVLVMARDITAAITAVFPTK